MDARGPAAASRSRSQAGPVASRARETGAEPLSPGLSREGATPLGLDLVYRQPVLNAWIARLAAVLGPPESVAQHLARAAAFLIVVAAAEASAIIVWLGAAAGAIIFAPGFLLLDWNWLKKATVRASDVAVALALGASLLLAGCATGAQSTREPVASPPTSVPTPAPTPTPFDLAAPATNDSTGYAEMNAACNWSDSTVAGCEAASVTIWDNAMTAEGLTPFALPDDFWTLPYDQQLLILANDDREVRDLPPYQGPTADLDADALVGAQARDDPPSLAGYEVSASNWANGDNTVVDEWWMVYNDGVGMNGDCTVASDPGCWGHRANILLPTSYYGTITMGAACTSTPDPPYLPNLSCGEIFVSNG